MTRNSGKDDGVRAFLRPPMGNYAFYSREYLATVQSCVMKAWPASGPNSTKRDVALTLLTDPELRLRVCHLEEILRGRQLAARQQVNGVAPGAALNGGHGAYGAGATATAGGYNNSRDVPVVQLQTALADPSFAALFELDPAVNDPDWGMQVLWLNMTQLQKELGLMAPPSSPPPPPSAAPPNTPYTHAPQLAPGPSSPASDSAAMGGGLSNGSPPPPQLVPEPSLVFAFESAFPNHHHDDDDYIAVAACFCLATQRDPRSLLPPFSLHLTDLTTHIRGYATADSRLAAVLYRIAASARRGASSGGGASPSGAAAAAPQTLAARVAEVLAAPRARVIFRQSESLSRKGERVVSLAVEQLVRNANGSSGGCAGRANGGRAASSNGALPLESWQRAGAAANGGSGGAGAQGGSGGGGASDGLPVFLFEYEAPSDLYGRDDMAMPLAAQRDQYGTEDFRTTGADGGSPVGRAPAHNSAAGHVSSPGAANLRSPSSAGTAQQQQQQQQQQHYHQQQAIQLPHAWSDAARTLSMPPAHRQLQEQLHPSASEPVPLPANVNAQTAAAAAAASLPRRSTEPFMVMQGLSDGGGGGGGGGDMGGYSGLGLGRMGSGWPPGAAEGYSPGSSFSNSMRYPLFNGNGSAETLFHQTLAAAAAAAAAGGGGGGGGGAPTAVMAASPGGPGGELHVPREISEVWSNAAMTSHGSAPGIATRRSSVTANGQSSGLQADGNLGGVFAMSPTHEQSYIWDRIAARSGGQEPNSAVGRPGAIDLSGFGFGFGFGYPGGGGGGGGGGMGSLVVGSAPPGMMPPFINCGGGGTALVDYASWHSSSPELSSSVGGRSAPAEETRAGSWLLAHGSRTSGGCGGGGMAGGGGSAAGRMLAAVAAAAAAAAGATGGGGATEAGALASRAGTGPSPSVSEESEEAAGVVGGLDLDPIALTLEAIIGFDPSSQLEAGADASSKGLIAAAAAPKTAGVYGAAAPSSSKSFATAAAAAGGDGSSHHSSFDSGDAIHGVGGAAGVLTGWSAMAARGLPPPPPSPHQHPAGLQLASTASGRLVGSPLQQAGATMTQDLAATMAAMGAAGGGGGAGSLAMARSGLLGPVSGSGMAAAMGLMPGAAVVNGASSAAAATARDLFSGKPLHPKLTMRVREEICQLIRTVPGLKVDDFDDGVLHQLTLKKSEDEAVGALRTLAAENLSGIQHMAAYINHIIKNYHLTGGPHTAGAAGATAASLPSATVRANSTPVSSKAILQKLPLRVFRRLEEVINKCSYMEWKHFDAGVVKVMAQLAEIGEEDVFEELELLKSTDLSNVEYMPAYLNKRLNNRLWSRRKMLTSAAAAVGGAGP